MIAVLHWLGLVVIEAISTAGMGVLLGIGIALGMAVVERRRRRWRRVDAAADETSKTPQDYEAWKPPSFEQDEPAAVHSAPASYQRTIGVEGVRAALESLAGRTYDLTPGDVRIELQDIVALLPPAKGNVSTDEELSGWDRAELERRFRTLQASHDYPRVQDVARIHELELLHQQACEQSQSDLDAKDKAQRATVDELLKEVGDLRLDRDTWRAVAKGWGDEFAATSRHRAETESELETCKAQLAIECNAKHEQRQRAELAEAELKTTQDRARKCCEQNNQQRAELARVRPLVDAAEALRDLPRDAGPFAESRLLRAICDAAVALPPREVTRCPGCEQVRDLREDTGLPPPGLCEECFKEWRLEQREHPQL